MATTKPEKKKALSPETEAIVKRLKSEGDLVRNSGTNSIKEIKINLEKFADAFTAIKLSSEQTAKVLTDSWEGNEALLKNIDESLVGLSDTEKDAELARRKEAQKEAIANKENKSESGILAQSLKATLSTGFKGLKDGFMAVKKDPWGTLLNIGKWAIILPVLAGAIKGLLDKLFGEGKMAEVYDKISNSWFVKTAMEYPIATLLTSLAAMAGLKWATLYSTMMLAAKTMGVSGGGGGPDVIGTGGDGPDKKTSKKARFKKLIGKAKGKGGLIVGTLSLVTIGGVQYMLSDEDEPIDLTADIAKINAAGDAEDAATTKKLVDTFENERKGFGTILSETLTGAAVGGGIGAVAGGVGAIPGAISGAIFGAVSGIGQVGFDFVDDVRNDVDKIPNELEKALKNEQRQNKLSLMYGRDQKAADLTAATTARVREIIDGLTTSNIGIDTNIKAMEDSLAGEITSKSTGIGRNKRTDEYVMFGGELVKVKEINERLEKAKKERLLREQQLITSRKILEMRTGELQAVEASVEQTNKLNDQVDEVAAKAAAAKPNIAPSVEERDKKQTVASGGFALNVTNNYITKGGDTMVQNKSDNRVSSQNSTNAVVFGDSGTGRFGGGAGLPTGGMS
jgi:hypothetical protein